MLGCWLQQGHHQEGRGPQEEQWVDIYVCVRGGVSVSTIVCLEPVVCLIGWFFEEKNRVGFCGESLCWTWNILGESF